MTTGLLGLLAAASGDAAAFCGTYVGQAGADLLNEASQMAVVRQDGVTTLTMVNDYSGDLDDFAFVIPVPKGLSEDNVSIADEHLVRTLEVYSGPRLVSYQCSDYGGWEDPRESAVNLPLQALPLQMAACSEVGVANDYALAGEITTGEEADESAVTVEAAFAEGEYEFVVVSAEDGGGLEAWLEGNGYALGEDAEVLLGSYIEAGHDFLAAKVSLEAVPAGATALSPIQLSYASEGFGLPLRLGTLNSPGTQDLILYTITSVDQGSVGIANYPQATLEDECMVDLGEQSFAEWYEAQVQEAFEASEGFVWLDEYSWSVMPSYAAEFYANNMPKCDPCPSAHQFPANAGVSAEDPLPDAVLEGLGVEFIEMEKDSGWWNLDPTLTMGRLHLRYDAAAVDQDLVLYATGMSNNEQMRFIQYSHAMESTFPICGEGWVTEDPGSCSYGRQPSPMRGVASYGCSSTERHGALVGLLGLAGALLLLRRRSS